MDSQVYMPRKRMPRSVDMLPHFKRALQTYCEPFGISVSKHRGSYTSENVMKLVSKTRQNIIRILYVKIRGSGAGFWGLNTNQVRAFKAQGHQWDVVLLLGPGERSYLGTSQNVEEGFEKWGSSAADYKLIGVGALFGAMSGQAFLLFHVLWFGGGAFLYYKASLTPQYIINRRVLAGKGGSASMSLIADATNQEYGCLIAAGLFVMTAVFIPIMAAWNYMKNYSSND